MNTSKESELFQPTREVVQEEKDNPYVPSLPYKPPIHFSKRFAKEKIKEIFGFVKEVIYQYPIHKCFISNTIRF